MGYRFSLVLSREITENELTALRDAGCGDAVFTTSTHPTRAEVTVTKLDFDDTTSPTLAEAIKAGLEAVKKADAPDVSIPSLIVPAQPTPAATEDLDVAVGEVVTKEPRLS